MDWMNEVSSQLLIYVRMKENYWLFHRKKPINRIKGTMRHFVLKMIAKQTINLDISSQLLIRNAVFCTLQRDPLPSFEKIENEWKVIATNKKVSIHLQSSAFNEKSEKLE